MSRFNKTKLALRMGVVAVPLAFLGFLISVVAVSAYKDRQPSRVVSSVTQNGLTAILGESTYYTPPDSSYSMPTTCPAPYTGTPPNCQPPADGTYTSPTDTTQPSGSTPTSSSPSQPSTYTSPPADSSQSYTMPTTCPAPYTGTPPNCQPAASSSQSSDGSSGTYTSPNNSGTEQCCRAPGDPNTGSSGSGTQSSGGQYPPPTFTKNDSGSCMEKLLGADAYAKFQAGGFNPTGNQIAKAQSCFSARISYSGSSVNQGPSNGGTSGPSANQGSQNFQVFANIPIAPPPAFQSDSPALACAKSIMGDRFGSPTPELISQVQSRCFSTATSGQQIGFIDPNNQAGRGGPLPGVAVSNINPGDKSGTPPALPSEVKACILKAGMSEAIIAAIQRGQSPTAAQQQQGENCFSQYAKDKGYTPPMLTPPDPTQPFDHSSKQNQCADLVAQTKGIKFNQITPAIVSTWSAGDVGKLRSCYGVSPTTSAGNNTMAFAPTSPQVAISSSKLTCLEQAVGADKLAAVVAGTLTMSQNDRKTVYDKCINPTKIAAGADPALLGILAAMPPSDLESLFIPIDSQTLPAPTAAGTSQSSADAEVAIGGEVNVAAGTALPTKVDVFVKSTSQTFTVALKNVSATKAVWTMNLGQNKLALGDHKAYAVATLGDATQTRSPDASFAITAAKAVKSNTKVIVGAAVAAVALVIGAWLGWRWHKGKGLPSLKLWHKKPKYT